MDEDISNRVVAACEEAEEFLRQVQVVPHHDIMEWVAQSNGTAIRQTRSVPFIGELTVQSRNSLFSRPAWEKLRTSMMKDPQVAPHFDPGFAIFGWRMRLDMSNFQLVICQEYFNRIGRLEFSDPHARSLANDLAAFFGGRTVGLMLRAPLVNVSCSDSLALDHDAVLRPLDPADYARILWPSAETVAPQTNCELAVSIVRTKTLGSEPVLPEWPLDKLGEDLVDAARLAITQNFQIPVHVPAWAVEFQRWTPAGGSTRTTSSVPFEPHEHKLHLSAGVVETLRSTWMQEVERRAKARGSPRVVDSTPPRWDIPFVSIYSLNAALLRPGEGQCGGLTLSMNEGPIEFTAAMAQRAVGPRSAGITGARARVVLAEKDGPYLILQTTLPSHDPDDERLEAARLSFAESRTLIELLHPGLIANRVFEGDPSGSAWIPEGPVHVVAQDAVDGHGVIEEAAITFRSLQRLNDDERSRFRLAARWFSRGQRVLDPIDKLLSLWIALEVHPGTKRTDIQRATCDYLKHKLSRPESRQAIEKKLGFSGRDGLTSARSAIVHDGKSHIGQDQREVLEANLAILEVVVATCLRLLAGLAPGTEVLRYLDG